MTRLAIVIVSFNARADLERCLASLAAHPASTPNRIVVVDNGSTDGSVALVRNRWPSVQMIEAGANLGFARATNLGIRQTVSDLILLLNSDTVVPPGAVDAMVRALDARPDVAVIGPRLVDASGAVEISFGRMLDPIQELRQKLLVRLHARGIGIVSRHVERMARREHEPDWVSGACLLVRRADAEAVGLLDERFFMYVEDVDFCAAIRARGRRVLFVPTVEVTHLRGRSAAAIPGPTAAAYRASQVAFYAKHRPAWVPLLRGYLRLTGKPVPRRE